MKVEGAEKFRNNVKALANPAKFNSVVIAAAQEWEGLAKRTAPKDQGSLGRSITSKFVKNGVAQVEVNANYAPYMEWGTKTRVNIPGDIAAYATQFKGNKGSGDAKKFIYAWCKRVGIDPKLWYFIYRKIMTVGVKPHPFFFIHKNVIQQKLNQELEAILK